MRKALVISTPLVSAVGVLLQILLGGTNALSFGNTSLTYTALLSIAAIIFSITVMLTSRKAGCNVSTSPKASGIILFIASLALGFDAIQGFLTNITSKTSSGAFPLLICGFEFVSAIVIVIFACKIFLSFELKHEKSLLLALIPIIWLLFKLAYEFLGYTRVANISAHYYHVLMTASTLLYLLYFFKSTSDGFKTSVNPVICLTLPLAFFSLVTVIPNLSSAISTSESLLDAISGFDIYCLLIAVFAYTNAFNLTFSNKKI